MIKRLERQADVNKIIEQIGESEMSLSKLVESYGFREIPEELTRTKVYLAYTKQNLIKYLGGEQ
jgi:hypothetical protein